MTTYNWVKQTLENKPETRNSDNLLQWEYLIHAGVVENGIITKSAFLNAPALETIRRCRQKVQEDHPELQANDTVKNYRAEKEKQYPSWVYRDGVAYQV